MDLKSLAATVSKFAPALGAALLGPPGAALGVGIASLFGVSADDPNLANLIATNPDAAVKLKEFETQLELAKIAQQNNDVNAEVADKANARHENNADNKISDTIIKIWLVIFASWMLYYCLNLISIDKATGTEASGFIYGIAATCATFLFGNIGTFFWGSSFSSQLKDRFMFGKRS